MLTYDEVQSELGTGRSHLLIGNGFSIACDSRFAYDSLFDFAKQHGLPETAAGVFERLGTNNFEGVMRLLEDSDWVAKHYGLLPRDSDSKFIDDLEKIKQSLIDAIAQTHPEHTHDVDASKKDTCVKFLEPFHNIFCTNYDLLLYWVEMHGQKILKGRDGFDYDINDPEAPYVVFSEHVGGHKGVYFIHGALHLYVEHGDVRKHSWTRTGKHLIDAIRESLSIGQYPLFVAEGNAEKKLTQIQNSGYLSYCLGKLERINNALVTYGLSFGENDQHIANVIAHNRNLKTLYVGLYGKPDSADNLETRKHLALLHKKRIDLIDAGRISNSLDIKFFNSADVPVWSPLEPDRNGEIVF
ncbi:MAG: DUF4917 family protein [Planctomycetaceae bacterium]|nr:DUF4917 family protein [Planctomycetaceae bacterium]MBL4886708.1 DUF4917 family protein [Planctomycetaceae bacterium]